MRRRLGPDCASSLKDWKYQKQMEFLMPYMFSRRALTRKEHDPSKDDDLGSTDDPFEPNRIFKPEVTYREDDDANDDGEYSKLY